MIFLLALPAAGQTRDKIKTVVIDAGHGGKDSGAVGKKCKEKDIALKVAIKTGNYIKKNCPDVEVIYTRDNDVFVPLNQRAKIANDNHADVFISIHCNAAVNSAAAGVETFVMGEHRNEANLAVAKLENAAILLEDDAENVYDGFDPNSTEAYIVFSLYQSENKHRSLSLAQNVQDQFVNRVGRKDRGVQQAGFLVLYRTTMPSILVELGFISNPQEENFILSNENQNYLASAIYRAFRDYKLAYEKENEVNDKIEPKKATQTKPAADTIKSIHQTSEPITTTPKVEQSQTEVKVKTNSIPQSTVYQSDDNMEKVVFRVQFDSRATFVSLSDSIFSRVSEIGFYEVDKTYKYTSGRFFNKADAIEHQNEMRRKGYRNAFVVAFYKGKCISMSRADQLMQQDSIQ